MVLYQGTAFDLTLSISMTLFLCAGRATRAGCHSRMRRRPFYAMHLRRLAGHHRRDGVLEDELLLIVVGVEHHRILVERPDAPGQLHPAQQINSDCRFVAAGIVEERILNVLRRLIVHRRSPYGGSSASTANFTLGRKERFLIAGVGPPRSLTQRAANKKGAENPAPSDTAVKVHQLKAIPRRMPRGLCQRLGKPYSEFRTILRLGVPALAVACRP